MTYDPTAVSRLLAGIEDLVREDPVAAPARLLLDAVHAHDAHDRAVRQSVDLLHHLVQHTAATTLLLSWHALVDDDEATTGDDTTTDLRHPCPTYIWATQDRDPVLSCWDPDDDEPNATDGEVSR